MHLGYEERESLRPTSEESAERNCLSWLLRANNINHRKVTANGYLVAHNSPRGMAYTEVELPQETVNKLTATALEKGDFQDQYQLAMRLLTLAKFKETQHEKEIANQLAVKFLMKAANSEKPAWATPGELEAVWAMQITAAQRELGLCYLNGIGVPKDEGQAAKWFKIAVDLGDSLSRYELAPLQCKMAAEEQKAKEAAVRATAESSPTAVNPEAMIASKPPFNAEKTLAAIVRGEPHEAPSSSVSDALDRDSHQADGEQELPGQQFTIAQLN